MTHTRLARYAPWIAYDYVLWGGVATFVLLLGFGWLAWAPVSVAIERVGNPELAAETVRGLAGMLTGTLGFLGPLIATNGIVSGDRHHGYYRFIFSRPVSPPRYYAAVFAINGAGFLIIAGLLWAIFAVAIRPIEVRNFLPMMALSYLFIGGILFLLSVLVRFDLAVGVVLFMLSSMAWGMLESGTVPWLEKARPVFALLPAFHRHMALMGSVTRLDVVVSWKHVVWVAAYGVICFGLGVLILRRRRLAE